MAENQVSITLNSQSYRLARDQTAQQIGGRKWQVDQIPVATTRIPRDDVRPGQIPGEWVITWKDWSKGCTGDRENLPGCLHVAENLSSLVPGSLRRTPDQGGTAASSSTNEAGAEAVWTGVFNGAVFSVRGRYVYRYDNGTETEEKDFGAGVYANDALVFNNTLLVALQGSNKLQIRDTAGTWAAATDNIYVTYLANVGGRLWVSLNTNEVKNCGPTDDPGLSASYSTAIPVGDDDYAITDLNAYGERLAVSKVNGLFLGNANADFPNVLPELETAPDPDNGKQTVSRGEDIFYPHANGLLRYNSRGVEEVGIQTALPHACIEDTSEQMPGTRIVAMCVEGHNLWASTLATGTPRARPTGFQKTTDNGSTYTDQTTSVTDGLISGAGTTAALGALDTVANGDWLVVGYSAAFAGVWLEFSRPNLNTASLTAEYWNGSAWTAFNAAGLVEDGTTIPTLATPHVPGTVTFARSGYVRWSSGGTSSWTASTINGINAFWVRLSVSAALSTTVTLLEAWIVTTNQSGRLWRGRPAGEDEVRGTSIIWQPYTRMVGLPRVGAMNYFQGFYPHFRGGAIVCAGRAATGFFSLSPSPADQGTVVDQTASSYGILGRHDGGMPNTNKQWTQFVLNGQVIDSDRDWALAYRLNDSTSSFTSASSSITSSPTTVTLSGVTGYAIQPKLTSNSFSSDALRYPEVNLLEAVFRELPTYKEVYTALIEVTDGQSGSKGGKLPNGAVQLTNLEALAGATAVSLRDPVGRTRTVNVQGVRVLEALQSDTSPPILVVQVVMEQV